MQKRSLILFFVLTLLSATAFTPRVEKFQWLNVNELKIKLKEQNKPVLIDVYTDWCHWCKVMDNKTYSNQKVADYLQDKFYCVKLNAETKDSMSWKEKAYSYNTKYKINEFALFLTNGQASFPTTVIIPDDHSAPIPIAGYMEPKELEIIVKYFGEGAYKTKSFPEFQKTFRASW